MRLAARHWACRSQDKTLPASIPRTEPQPAGPAAQVTLTTLHHLLLAAWAANTEGKPMLVANVGGEDAVLVTPPNTPMPIPVNLYWAAEAERFLLLVGNLINFVVGMSPMNKEDGNAGGTRSHLWAEIR